MKRNDPVKNKNTNTDPIPCIDCLILPICIQKSKPPNRPGVTMIPPFLSPLIIRCSLLRSWFAQAPLYTKYNTELEKVVKFFEDQYGK